MYHQLKKLHGYKIAASDGHIGHVKDFYFDDHTWAIRYLVVDTGSWLSGRLVLIAPHAFGYIDEGNKIFTINLSKHQIEHSPSIDAHKPVSRQYEIEYYTYYGYPTYWSGGGLWGMGGYPVLMPVGTVFDGRLDFVHRDDLDLRSAATVTGYHIEASDGTLGSVTDFKVDDRSWAIREIVVEAGHWYSGKEVLISPWKVERISYAESKVFVKLSKAEIRQTAEHDIVQAHA